MRNHTFETLVGAVVIAIAVVFVYYAYSRASTTGVGGYEISARFNRVDGIAVGSDVLLSGIRVGTVSRMELDAKNYDAIIHIMLAQNVKLPDDSSIKITSSGLLGSAYLAIEPGGSDNVIPAGGQIANTQGSIDLVGLLGKFMFSADTSGTTKSPSATEPAPEAHP
ncbi:MAG: outer membrane lipid asymmetry maintenance protein MlaD [Alphaproteobacteria bacterium]